MQTRKRFLGRLINDFHLQQGGPQSCVSKKNVWIAPAMLRQQQGDPLGREQNLFAFQVSDFAKPLLLYQVLLSQLKGCPGKHQPAPLWHADFRFVTAVGVAVPSRQGPEAGSDQPKCGAAAEGDGIFIIPSGSKHKPKSCERRLTAWPAFQPGFWADFCFALGGYTDLPHLKRVVQRFVQHRPERLVASGEIHRGFCLPQLAPFAGPPPPWSPPWWPGMGLGVPHQPPGEHPWPSSAAWPMPELPKSLGSQGSTELGEPGDSDPSAASSPQASRKVRVELNLAERTSPPEFRVDACGPPGPFFTPTKTRTSFRADAPVFVPREQDGFETPAKEEATANDEVRYVRSRMLRVRQYLEDSKGSNRDEGETSGKSLQWKTAKRSQVTAEHLHGAGYRELKLPFLSPLPLSSELT
eukprot:s540_g15.t1